tara:strand:- start:38 stop:3478 length:3441 start_codon:yes stop_codon:yes gene_type:complete
VVPPKLPPSKPITPPPGEPPVPIGVQEAIDRAAQFRKIDMQGFTGAVIDKIPGLNRIQKYLSPGRTIPDDILTAFVGETGEAARFSTQMFPSRQNIMAQIERVFGKGASRGKITNVRFIGEEADDLPLLTGRVFDIAQRPHLYELNAVQRELLTSWQERNSQFFKEFLGRYGVKVDEFVAPDGGVFLSNVDVADDVLEAMNTTQMGAARVGRGKERIFNTAADRMKSDPDFVPLTDLRMIQSAMDEWKAGLAGKQVFKIGSGGKTLTEVIDLTHPGLRRSKITLTNQIQNLKVQLRTVERQIKTTRGSIKQTTRDAEAARKRAGPFLDRIDELGEEWGAELSFLSGQTRELLLRAQQLERRGAVLTTQVGARGAKAKSLLTRINELHPKLEQLRKRYKAANLGGWRLAKVKKPKSDAVEIYGYFKGPEADIVEELQNVSTNTIARTLDEIRGTAFAGDFSPILGIQLPLGVIFDPKTAITRLIGAGRDAVRNKDLLRSFRAQTLADDVTRDVAGYQDWAFYTGQRVAQGTPQEFSGGLLRYLPGFTKTNEAMYAAVIRQSKSLFDKQLAIMARSGTTGDQAAMLAADMATKVYPVWNPSRLGLSSARAAAIRSVPTSVSFLMQPAALIGEASTGFGKMFLGQAMTMQERLAIQLVLTAGASTMTLSVTSAVLSALARGLDPYKEAKKVINPTSGSFMSVTIGNRRIPLGGPFRGLIKVIAPREVDWAPVPVPFATIGSYIRNRLNPGIKAQVDLLINQGFHGEKLRKGKMPEQILRTLLYELESMSPLTLGETISGVRRGESPADIAEQAAAQFAGTNLWVESLSQQRRNMIEEEAERTYGIKKGDEIDRDDLKEIGKIPAIAELEQRHIAEQLKLENPWYVYQRDSDLIREQWVDESRKAGENRTGADLRDQLDRLSRDHAIRQEGRRKEAEGEDVLDFIDDIDEPENKFNIALNRYYAIMNGEDVEPGDEPRPPLEDPATGIFNYAELEARRVRANKDESIKGVGLGRILAHVRDGDPPEYRALQDARETLRDYWNKSDEYIEKNGQRKEAGSNRALSSLYNEYLAKPSVDKAFFRGQHPLLDGALRAISLKRRIYRQIQDPIYDLLLVRYGYDDDFLHEYNKIEQVKTRTQDVIKGLPVGTTP